MRSSTDTLLLHVTSFQAKFLVTVSGGQIRVTCLCPSAKESEKTQGRRQCLTLEKPNSSMRKKKKKLKSRWWKGRAGLRIGVQEGDFTFRTWLQSSSKTKVTHILGAGTISLTSVINNGSSINKSLFIFRSVEVWRINNDTVPLPKLMSCNKPQTRLAGLLHVCTCMCAYGPRLTAQKHVTETRIWYTNTTSTSRTAPSNFRLQFKNESQAGTTSSITELPGLGI